MNRILGLDPGLANMGYALVEVDMHAHHPGTLEQEHWRVLSRGTWQTEADENARYKNDDLVRRARWLGRQLVELTQPHATRGQVPPALICAERLSYPRSARSAAMLSLSWGLLVMAASLYSAPVLTASPQDIKKHLCGRRNASKKDVQDRLEQSWPGVWDGLPQWSREHAADALGAVVTCSEQQLFRAVIGGGR